MKDDMIKYTGFLILTAACSVTFAGDMDVRPILEEHCFDCHNTKKQKGDIDLSSLPRLKIDESDAEVWRTALDMINADEMPPEKKPRLSTHDLTSLTGWLENTLTRTADELRAAKPLARLRRLNRTEYRNTIRDLTGHPFDAAELFTVDTSSHGFDNVGDVLQVSSLHIEGYVAAAERVVSKIIDIPKKKPERQHWRIINSAETGTRMKTRTGAWHKGHDDKDKTKIKPGKLKGNVLPNAEIPNGSTPYTMLDLTTTPPTPYDGSWDIRAFGGTGKKGGAASLGFKWFAFEEGMYRVRVAVESFNEKGWPHNLTIARYPEGTDWKEERVSPGKHSFEYELYRDSIPWYVKTSGNRNWGLHIRYSFNDKHPYHGLPPGPHGLHVSSIEVEGPINKTWPPTYHQRVFHERKADTPDRTYARQVLTRFMTRAYRRPATGAEVDRMLLLYDKERKTQSEFLNAMRLPLTTVLCSPDFLYLSGPHKRQPAAYALANRLSYFLWRSMPDSKLFALAKTGALLKPEILKAQVSRMLKDDRSDALVSNFTQQWLGLRGVRNLQADRQLYPGYSLALQDAMVAESEAFFRHILENKLPLKTFLDSDFVMVNETMARHYALPNVTGPEFRPVKIRPGHNRGGVLGQAAVLTATSNGIRTLPVTRGVFILENILGTPPSPPPPDVTPLEDVKTMKPDATIREKLEIHRSNPNCARCHNKIDPLGFALENYNAIGQFRSFEKKVVPGKGRQKGAPVDATGKLPDGREFKSIAEFKKLLMEDSEKFIHCFTEKMLVYALDRPISFSDRRYVDELGKRIKKNGATLSDVIEQIVLSEPFSGARP